MQTITNIIENEISKYFSSCCCFFLINSDNSLCHLIGKQSSNDTPYTNNMIKYSLFEGITGQAIIDKKVVGTNNPRDSKQFLNLVDNIGNIDNLKNILMIPLFSKKEENLGIIQIINIQEGIREEYIV